MNEAMLNILQSGNEEEMIDVLKNFNVKYAQAFVFPDIKRDVKEKLIESLVDRLNMKGSARFFCLCLETIRILSREKQGMEAMTRESVLRLLIQHAGLYVYEPEEVTTSQGGDTKVMVEAQKCLCNIIFNSPTAQRICSGNSCVDGIVMRLKTYKTPDCPELIHDIKFFDMRILFLLTALCADIRPKLRSDLHGLTYLIEVLDLTLRDKEEKDIPLNDKDIDLCCEILKILFNLTVSLDKRSNLDEEEEAHFLRLVSVLHDLLTCRTASKDKKEELHSHTVNLLTNMPPESYEELLTPMNEGAAGGVENKDVEYDGRNMEAVVALLSFLDGRLDTPQRNIKESLTPILHCLCECCRANRNIRKFCRVKVLPHLRDEVKRLPEEGDSVRNKLCKLLTNPVTEVKDLSADFLFVLCKESVARFVKYTGYGNAAGLLAQRGLMCGGRSGQYHSESEESETEEYAELKNKINPVTGRYEEERPNPMEGMSDEQKEYEAMELVKALDKLNREGVVQPMCVGDDGRPRTMDHILRLVEGMSDPSQLPTHSDED